MKGTENRTAMPRQTLLLLLQGGAGRQIRRTTGTGLTACALATWPEGSRVPPEMSVSHTDCLEMILGFLPQPLVIAGEPIGMPFLCQFSVGGL